MTSIPTLFVPPVLTTCTTVTLALQPSGDTGSLTRGPYNVLVIPTPGSAIGDLWANEADSALERIANLSPSTNGQPGSVNPWRVDIPAGVPISFIVVDANGEQITTQPGNARVVQAGSDQSCMAQNSGINAIPFFALATRLRGLRASASLPPYSWGPPSASATAATKNDDMALSGGAMAGIIVGAIAAIIAALLAAFLLVRRRRSAKKARDEEQANAAKVDVVRLPAAGEEKGEKEKVWDDASSDRSSIVA